MKAYYEMFGTKKLLPVVVYYNGHQVDPENGWEETLWIERGEDWYALHSPQLKTKRVRVMTREEWLNA